MAVKIYVRILPSPFSSARADEILKGSDVYFRGHFPLSSKLEFRWSSPSQIKKLKSFAQNAFIVGEIFFIF